MANDGLVISNDPVEVHEVVVKLRYVRNEMEGYIRVESVLVVQDIPEDITARLNGLGDEFVKRHLHMAPGSYEWLLSEVTDDAGPLESSVTIQLYNQQGGGVGEG